jgi:hypothetical protein
MDASCCSSLTRLVRKDEDAVTIECCVDLGKDLGHHRADQIDTPHLGAESGMKRAEADRHVAPLPCAVRLICAGTRKRSI